MHSVVSRSANKVSRSLVMLHEVTSTLVSTIVRRSVPELQSLCLLKNRKSFEPKGPFGHGKVQNDSWWVISRFQMK